MTGLQSNVINFVPFLTVTKTCPGTIQTLLTGSLVSLFVTSSKSCTHTRHTHPPIKNTPKKQNFTPSSKTFQHFAIQPAELLKSTTGTVVDLVVPILYIVCNTELKCNNGLSYDRPTVINLIQLPR